MKNRSFYLILVIIVAGISGNAIYKFFKHKENNNTEIIIVNESKDTAVVENNIVNSKKNK